MKPMSNEYEEYENYIASVIENMTPLERATHASNVTAYLMASYGQLAEYVQQILEFEELAHTCTAEEEKLLMSAELGLRELLKELPLYGEA
jgi:hypothetical protein